MTRAASKRLSLPILLLLACTAARISAQSLNGFDLSDTAVPADTIQAGTIRDGIKALDAPVFESADEATELSADTRVLGLRHGGLFKAYPIDLLTYHEIVNDAFTPRPGSEEAEPRVPPVVVTWCPLCGSGVAYLAETQGRRLRFGVSGLLHNSDLLMFDRRTESLWSQIGAQAISGPMKGRTLTPLPLIETTWGDWKQRHPDTLVLSRPTGFGRRYDRPLYPGYAESPELWFPVAHQNGSIPPKARVLGLELDGQARVWPFSELQREAERREQQLLVLNESLAGRQLVLRFDAVHQSASISSASGRALPGLVSYWFAWYAFHPGSSVYGSAEPVPPRDAPPPRK